MKIFTAVFLFAVILGRKIEADAGSFNFSGSFDPGISFGRANSLQQKYQARHSEDDDVNTDWPQPNHINNLEVPESFNDPIPNETDANDNQGSLTHHHGSHHRAHRP